MLRVFGSLWITTHPNHRVLPMKRAIRMQR